MTYNHFRGNTNYTSSNIHVSLTHGLRQMQTCPHLPVVVAWPLQPMPGTWVNKYQYGCELECFCFSLSKRYRWTTTKILRVQFLGMGCTAQVIPACWCGQPFFQYCKLDFQWTFIWVCNFMACILSRGLVTLLFMLPIAAWAPWWVG